MVRVVAKVQYAGHRVAAAGVILIHHRVVDEGVEVPLLARRRLVEIVEQIPHHGDVGGSGNRRERKADACANRAGEIDRIRVSARVRSGEVQLHNCRRDCADKIRAVADSGRRRREDIRHQGSRHNFQSRREAVCAAGNLFSPRVDGGCRLPTASAAAAVIAAADCAGRVRRTTAVDIHENVPFHPSVRAIEVEHIVVGPRADVIDELQNRAWSCAARVIEHIVVSRRFSEEAIAHDSAPAARDANRAMQRLKRARCSRRENCVAHQERAAVEVHVSSVRAPKLAMVDHDIRVRRSGDCRAAAKLKIRVIEMRLRCARLPADGDRPANARATRHAAEADRLRQRSLRQNLAASRHRHADSRGEIHGGSGRDGERHAAVHRERGGDLVRPARCRPRRIRRDCAAHAGDGCVVVPHVEIRLLDLRIRRVERLHE